MSAKKTVVLFSLIAVCGLASGCDEHEAKTRGVNALRALMGKAPLPTSSSQVAKTVASEADRKLEQSAQLLREIFQVVWMREPYGANEFGAYVNALSQGGSLEGIYNGFVNSEPWHHLEEKSPPVDASTLRLFAEEISILQKDLSTTKMKPTDFGVSAPFDPARYEVVFQKASLHTLKRLLGNEAMKVLEVKRTPADSSRDELAQWYAAWATRTASRQVDFGLALRNKADIEFHRQWVKALPADSLSDRLIWEVLNRTHRMLNVTEAKASQRLHNGG